MKAISLKFKNEFVPLNKKIKENMDSQKLKYEEIENQLKTIKQKFETEILHPFRK